MKAVVVHEYGAPEVLKFEQYPDPVAGTSEVLVRVAATSINPFDIMRRSGIAKEVAPIKFPGIVGVDLSGTVVAIGTEAGGFSIGDQVFGMADQTYAEFCAVKPTNLEKIPEGLDLIDAAALPLVTTTGNQLFTLGAGVKAGHCTHYWGRRERRTLGSLHGKGSWCHRDRRCSENPIRSCI